MSTLTVDNVTKTYGDVVALDSVSFEIENEFVVLLGESGAGKSTMLRCVNGLTHPTEGEIRLNGDPINGSRSDIGMIFQQHNLVDGVSAYMNALTGSLDRTSTVSSLLQQQNKETKERALEALQTVGLLEESHQRTSQMSGGQQQRVGIARALVQDPALLLADEPVASLDPSSAESVMDYLKKAASVHEVTALVSLHQVNIAAYFGERFIGLRDGEILFDVSPEKLTPGLVDDLYGNVETVGLATDNSDNSTVDTSDGTRFDTETGSDGTDEVDVIGRQVES